MNKNIFSMVRDDGTLIETLYQPKENQTTFAIFKDQEVSYASQIEVENEKILIPMSPENNLLKSKVILLPSDAIHYENDDELVKSIRLFVHKYLHISELFEQIITYYILFTWVYDRFNELPYLRVLGDYGTGKSRFLKVVGSLCYKPIFANGAITTSPIFRIIEMTNGTLILNEADFHMSETWSDITKILNNGFETGFPVLRTESHGKSFEVCSFNVFGPKIIAARDRFVDQALESRFLTEEMGNVELRKDIPINLPDTFWEEALKIRNQLLMWRFQNYDRVKLNNLLVNNGIEPRLNQIAIPICSIIGDEKIQSDLRQMIIGMNKQILKDRGMTKEADIIEAIIKLQQVELSIEPTVKMITTMYNDGKSEKEQITSKKMGWWLRTKLNFTLERNRDGYFLSQENINKVMRLKSKYGIEDMNASTSSQR